MRRTKDDSGWEVHEILDPHSNLRTNKYFFKRRRAPRIELSDKISQQFAAYALIEKDLRNVLIWLGEIENLHPLKNRTVTKISPNREDFSIVKGLYVAALTFYGKCYTTCEGRRVKLEKNIMDEEFIGVHDDIMHMRHNFAAHSGADSFEEVKIALVLPPNIKSDAKPKIVRELRQPDFMDDTEKPFQELVKHVQRKVIQKMSQIENKIYENEIAPKGKKYWYKRAK